MTQKASPTAECSCSAHGSPEDDDSSCDSHVFPDPGFPTTARLENGCVLALDVNCGNDLGAVAATEQWIGSGVEAKKERNFGCKEGSLNRSLAFGFLCCRNDFVVKIFRSSSLVL